jgi:predicted small lipoprotein YifL
MSAGWRIVAIVLVALALAGCGKKSSPSPPQGVPNTYPQPYPRQ